MILGKASLDSTFLNGIDYFLDFREIYGARDIAFVIPINPDSLKKSVIVKDIVFNVC